jgi:hypothetical protein
MTVLGAYQLLVVSTICGLIWLGPTKTALENPSPVNLLDTPRWELLSLTVQLNFGEFCTHFCSGGKFILKLGDFMPKSTSMKVHVFGLLAVFAVFLFAARVFVTF